MKLPSFLWAQILPLRPQEVIKQEEEIEEQVFLQTRKYNQDTKRIDVSQQGCTEMKTSRRVIFPPGRTAKEEATLEVRTNLWREILDSYVAKHCKEDGTQITTQLSHKQERGKTKILKRVMTGEIHVSPADKGKSVVVMPQDLYYRMVQSHTAKDEIVPWRRLDLAQKLVRSQARSLAKIFQLGASKGERNQARCHDNSSSWACDPPVLRATAKTHKSVD